MISDTKIPYQDERAVQSLLTFLRDFQPDEVIQIGDLMDYPASCRWSAGTRAELALKVRKDGESAKRIFLAPLRKVYTGSVKVLEGKCLDTQVSALAADGEALHYRNLLDFDGFGIEPVKPIYRFAPGWGATHGHEMKGLNQIADHVIAVKARNVGISIVTGHTRRLALSPETTGLTGDFRTLYNFEVGHLMDPRKAGFLMGRRPASGALGFGLFYIEGLSVTPQAVSIQPNGSFVVEGNTYGARSWVKAA
ncbi:hypothetical protein OG241_06040 [Streptomyces sp. NBC_01390]|uniref:hypothetical protein n=1 Tax=Streptomyces sp. NBC_01390 TaxID=2903850 RepID=UPI00325070B4